MRRLLVAAIFMALGLCPLGAPAEVASHRVLVLNDGNEPIFTVRFGHAQTNLWSGDLLEFNQVIDVSRGRDLAFVLDPATCEYDVEATYSDGATVVLRDVDLCSVPNLTFSR